MVIGTLIQRRDRQSIVGRCDLEKVGRSRKPISESVEGVVLLISEFSVSITRYH